MKSMQNRESTASASVMDHNEALEFREMLKDLIKERLGIDEIGIYQIGATIGVHTGPYPIGIGIIKHAEPEA